MEKAPIEDCVAVTVNDFARHVCLSRATVWRRIKAGDVRTVKIGPRTMIPRAEVLRIASALAA